ncbi:hypothetical protein J2785_006894 [Burkholderia ambifaria]|nr:hypothetical protein [Burkholderia ambifaria]MDR6503701.1 hypothetical protein [Burkholderia ambifaria]
MRFNSEKEEGKARDVAWAHANALTSEHGSEEAKKRRSEEAKKRRSEEAKKRRSEEAKVESPTAGGRLPPATRCVPDQASDRNNQ